MRQFLRHPSIKEAKRVLKEDWKGWARLTAFVIVIFFAIFSVEKAEDSARKVEKLTVINHNLVTSLQRAVVETCEQFGNERAKVTRETLHEEIASAEHPDPGLIEALSIPPETLQRITQEKIAELEDRLSRVKLTNCQSQYKISPGSGARRRAES